MAWLSGYGFRQKVPLKRTDGAVSDYQMKLTVNKTTGNSSGAVVYLKGHALSWTGTVPNDIRFTKADGTSELDYWIESSDANTATVWIEFDSIGTTDTDFYIYYDKSGDTTTSNGDNTFLFFDDFPGDSLDTDKWEGDTAYASIADSILTYESTSTDWRQLHGKTGISKSAAWRGKVKYRYTGTPSSWGGDAGFRKKIDLDYLGFYDSSVASKALRSHVKDGAWNKWADQTQFVRDAYAIWDILWKTDNARYFVDGVECDDSPVTTDVPAVDMSAFFGSFDNPIYADWVLLRNWADPEPTWETWGSEETAAAGRSWGCIIG